MVYDCPFRIISGAIAPHKAKDILVVAAELGNAFDKQRKRKGGAQAIFRDWFELHARFG